MKIEEKEYLRMALDLLKNLISVPSFSNEETAAADIWEKWLHRQGITTVARFHNNVYALNKNYDNTKPNLLLNSHLDTVRPVESWSRDPFEAAEQEGKIYGLGSNDAGGSGVGLAITFLKLWKKKDLPFNIILALTASEEKMGELGMRSFLPYLREKNIYPDMAIVGEPTECKGAVAERGLVVCDAITEGVSGHAAREEGINAIYRAIDDIYGLKTIKFDKTSDVLGSIKVSVTMIESGTQHNVVPDKCKYVIDVRTTDAYSNEETVELLKKAVKWSKLTPRSTRIQASVLPLSSPLWTAAKNLGISTFVSPTTSDMALMYDIPSIKIGPGKSSRSHTADEFIEIEEIRDALEVYENYILELVNILR